MKYILKSEEVLMFALSLYLFKGLNFSWGWYFIFILTPDLSMIGYLIDSKTGAYLYNIAHHKGLAISLFLTGVCFQAPYLQFAGILLFSHSSLDRILGYGLKFTDSFQNTHLGKIGKQ